MHGRVAACARQRCPSNEAMRDCNKVLDALVFRIAEAIRAGEDQDTLQKWASAAKTAPMCAVASLLTNPLPIRIKC